MNKIWTVLCSVVVLASISGIFGYSASASDSSVYEKEKISIDMKSTDELFARDVHRVTLITGDVILARLGENGKTEINILPTDHGSSKSFRMIKSPKGTYIFPEGIDLRKLDRELFNIDYLIEESYYNQTDLPVLIDYVETERGRRGDILELRERFGNKANTTVLKSYRSTPTFSAKISYKGINKTFKVLTERPDVKKIWLDKKVKITLYESVPLTGATELWKSGYNGSGIEIAILDTGIDDTHPDLDDLDNNPSTNDPKVVRKEDFTDDNTTVDLYGHGTHCAGIAAGTGNAPTLVSMCMPTSVSVSTLALPPFAHEDYFEHLRDHITDPVAGTDDESVHIPYKSLLEEYAKHEHLHFEDVKNMDYGIKETQPDSYEPDNDHTQANWVPTNGSKQIHDFHVSKDWDYVKFNATESVNYLIKTSDLGSKSDTYMYIYDTDGITEITQDDDSGEGFASRIVWRCGASDIYYIKIRHYSSSACGPDTYYNISVLGGYISPAELNDVYSDYGEDTDDDKLYNYLTINVGVDVTNAGNYYVSGELCENGTYNSIDHVYNTTHLNQGSQTVQLRFEGMQIGQNEHDGSYDLKYLYLYDSSTGDQLDCRYDAYTTSHYNYTDFQDPSAEFNDVYSDYGEDTDDDGLYNYLTIDVGVNVTNAGNYRAKGYLYVNTGYSIDYEFNTTYLSAGSQIVQLNFEGMKIRQNEVNGPYNLKSLYLYDSSTGDQLDYIYDAYTTSHYNYTDFQIPPAEFNDVYSDYGEDTDDDGLYNYLTIDVDVNVTNAGNYRVIGYLNDNTGYSIDYKFNTTYLSAGSQIVQLNFKGMKIRQNEVNGPYDLKSLCLYDSTTGDQLDYIYDAYTTSHYNYTDFQDPPAEFNDVYSDYGEGTDNDELYNYLTIDVGVNVTNAGNCQVSGELYETETYDYVCHVYKSIYLTQGTWTVQLKFDGIKIQNNGYNGTFDLKYLQLYNSSTDDQLDYIYDAYTTSYYNYTDFQEFPRYIGVAPCAELWNIKVLNQYGYGYDSWIIDGIEYAAYGPDGMPNTGDEADIISMGLDGGPTDGTGPLSRAVNDAVDHGLVVVVAAGNSGTDYFTVSSPGTASDVITVGASTKYDGLAWFSSCGPTPDTRVKPDVLAPGVGIIAPRANGTSMGDPINEYYTEASGTSMATPHVAGAAALMLQAHTDWNPWSVKDALISTADDLGYNAYKQGGGRIHIPSAVNTKISVDPATISFVNSSDKTITFRNIDAVSHTITLDVVVYEALADNQVDCASLNRTSLDIAPGSSVSVLLTVDTASLPKSIYSGTVIANIDSKEQIHAIFGFSNLNEVRVNKINMTESLASGDLVMVFSDTEDGRIADGVTDENGTVVFNLPDGMYNIISGEGDIPGASVYTVKENISIEADMNIALDERDAKIIDFDCNKAEQIISEKYDCVQYDGTNISVGFGSSRGYTDETKTYITPTNSFKSIFSYSYYPETYYNGSDIWLINTPEWHKVLYNLSSVTEDVTFVANYDHLVERTTDYKVALEPELASWWYHAWHPDMLFSITCVRRMNAPQSRVEWLSPEPITYSGGYEQYTEWWDGTYPNWNYYTNQKYTAGTETYFASGEHPLKSGTEIYVENGYLEIYGYISEDVFENVFANYSCDVSGNLTIIKDGETIMDHESVQHYFQEYVYFSGIPRFDVITYGISSPNLSTHTKTELGFTADPTSDYRPPNITISVVDSDMYNCVTGGNVKLNLTVNDETSISSVDLKYSINNGSTWDEASIMQINGNEWMVNTADLNGYYVSIMANATDSIGNSISHTVINGFCVSSELPVLGDVNHDGMLSTVDAVLVLQMASGIDVDPAADINDDGQATSLDALMILQAAADAI